jgi:hypothetical protein
MDLEAQIGQIGRSDSSFLVATLPDFSVLSLYCVIQGLSVTCLTVF